MHLQLHGFESVEKKKKKIQVKQAHFIWNEIQPSCISPLPEITMTRNASDQFGRQSRMSFSSLITACSYAGHCSQTEILQKVNLATRKRAVETAFSKGTPVTSEDPGRGRRSHRARAGQYFSGSRRPASSQWA